MAVFELAVALLFVGAVLAACARRVKVPYPALLALAGAALALLPGTPSVTLDPELALALFVAPVLLDAAYDASPRDLKQNWRTVTALALVAVGVTVAAVALVVRWVVPAIPWPAAIALGAIVAPPDAAAATAVLRQLRPPHRVLVILEERAFCVVLGTLVLQGMTVRPLMRRLALKHDDSVEHEVHLARAETARAALDAVDASGDGSEIARLLRSKYEARLRRAQARADRLETLADDDETRLVTLSRGAQEAQRRTLYDLRTRGVIGDDAFHRVEEELDWGDVNLEGLARRD